VARGGNLRQRLADQDRYRGLNFAALGVHNTLEVRLLQGTVSVRLIESWVAFTQRLVRMARYRANIQPGTSPTQFQVLGAVTQMLSRNGYQASAEEEDAFNLLSSYYHKHKRMIEPRGVRNAERVLGE